MEYSIPKGTFDILPNYPDPEEQWKNSNKWEYLESILRQTAYDYGFQEIRTPIFERTELFLRGVGETSDIVTKEMYTFNDKGGRSLTLRPEGTAPAMRAFVENKLSQASPAHKLFYYGPMFRYERPQAGRYRQHHQFGAEAIGIAKPEQDVEMIDMLCELYRRLGIGDLVIMINSVGDADSRGAYLQALQNYLKPHVDHLSPESQARFVKNPLRILDSKDPGDKEILENAPSILDMLGREAADHFSHVQNLLEKIKIPYIVNTRLVRGLDYYNRTVFEIVSGKLGAQNTIGAGGRYDKLIGDLGGGNLPAVGFATGLERILQIMEKQQTPFPEPPHPLVYFIPLGEAASQYCFKIVAQLRKVKIPVDMDLSGKKVQSGMQTANRLRAIYAIVLGDNELSAGTVELKNMQTRVSLHAPLTNLIKTVQDLHHHV